MMRVLTLEPYYAGSHRSFLESWIRHSRHDWTVLSLPGYKWKWRMRHSAVTFAHDVNERIRKGESWDIIWCSDMLNLAEFLGLVDSRISQLPTVVYFHENQLAYPVQQQHERDMHFAMTNFTSCLAANEVWFNSEYHRGIFLTMLEKLLNRMPDYQPIQAVDRIRDKSAVHYPGIEPFPERSARAAGPLRILWAARWEYDKDPDSFFAAIKQLKESGTEFRLSAIGPQFQESPPVFSWAKEYLTDNIDHWGYIESANDYRSILMASDVIVSTAIHEFFGISVVEAIAAGAYPLLPRRLAYPELLGNFNTDEYFYDGSVSGLVDRLQALEKRLTDGTGIRGERGTNLSGAVSRYHWSQIIPQLDSALEELQRQTDS